MADHRTAWEQAKFGLRISGLFLLGVCLFGWLVAGLAFMVGKADSLGGHHPLLGAGLTAALVFVLFKTTKYWAKWLVGILGLFVLRFFFGLGFKWFYELPKGLSIREGLAWFAYLGAALALTVRHASRKPEGAENLGLVSFVVCVALAMAVNNYMPLLYGLGLLAIAEGLQRFVLQKRRHKSAHPSFSSKAGS